MAYGRKRKGSARRKAPSRGVGSRSRSTYRARGSRTASRKRARKSAGASRVKQQTVRLEIIQRPLEAAPAAMPDTRKEIAPKRARL